MARVAAYGSVPAEYLALGDSYTIGEGVHPEERWPMQLAADLRARGIALAQPHFIAESGWTTDELSAAIDEEVAQRQVRPPYGLVSLQIGVNDQYRGRDVAAYLENFSALLDRAIEFAGGQPQHTLVVSIPDYGMTPYARSAGRDPDEVARQIDSFNAAASEACRQRGVSFVDITGLSRQPSVAAMLVADGLHPSGDMYRLWADRIQAAMPV